VSAHSVLFCPFCRESFEGIERCPSHDLALIDFRELARAELASDDARLPVQSLRGGRGWLFAGALLTLCAFFLPLAQLSGAVDVENSLGELTARAPRLWLVPAAALATLSVLARRRTPAGMRGARLVVGLLALVPSAVVVATLVGTRTATAQLAESLGSQVHAHVGAGAWLVWGALAPLLWGSLRFGVMPRPRVR
jgi:hypothetical protein